MIKENKTTNYLKYAIGEIVLVVIGILIALQVNNWNEHKKLDSQFKTSIENLYNSITFDVENFQILLKETDKDVEMIPQVLDTPKDSINAGTLINAFFCTGNKKPYYSETPFFLNNLKTDPNNNKQTEIVKEINNYVNFLQVNHQTDISSAYQMLLDEGVPPPKPIINTSEFYKVNLAYYTNYHFERFKHLLDQPKFKAEMLALKTERTYRSYELSTKIGAGKSILALIKNYYPNVKILYKDVGIIGTAINGFDNAGVKSTPMIETDFDNSIWELELHLKKGFVKFRCRDSWAINWGGDSFPEGKGYQDGRDIEIPEEGLYHVTLDLTKQTYKFVKLHE